MNVMQFSTALSKEETYSMPNYMIYLHIIIINQILCVQELI